MIELTADSWSRFLTRIGAHHTGVYIVVRLYEGGQEPAGVVLWHVPLRALRLTDESCIEIQAGDPVTPIVYTTKPIQTVFADFSDDKQRVRRLRFEAENGDHTVMVFERS